MRIALLERPPMRQLCRRNRIAVRRIAASPPIEHAQDDRPVSFDGARPERSRRAQDDTGVARSISVAKPSGSSEAPPTRPPLMSESSTYDATFAGVMLPP